MEYTFYDFLKLLGSLALFLYGMKTMSEGLQKFAGDRMRQALTVMTRNRVAGVLTGVLITALVQSSSATTVMVVSFVNAGLLTLSQSISVIMGANIGTTVTAWLISALGFKVDIGSFVLPLLAVGVPFLFARHSRRRSMGEFVIGFSLLFMGLGAMTANAPDLSRNPDMLSFLAGYTDMGFGSVILFLLAGTVLTMVVQASSATMAITLVMCANGWIDFELGAAIVLGENIGTTITANLAALTANTQARRAAMAHLMFNVFGVIWVLALFYPFTSAVSWLVTDVMGVSDPAVAVTFKLSAFHTAFNVCNTCIMIWLVRLIERTVCTIIPKRGDDDEFRLRYISGGLLSTAELSLLQAGKEIDLFAERVTRMFGMVRSLTATQRDDDFNKLFSRIEKYENICDSMEIEIARELESIGDSCYNLARTTVRARGQGRDPFTADQTAHLHRMFDLVDEALRQMNGIVRRDEHGEQRAMSADVNHAFNIEAEINNFRSLLKDQNLADIDARHYDYQSGASYMDMVSECEKLGDYVVNVIEAHCNVNEKHLSGVVS